VNAGDAAAGEQDGQVEKNLRAYQAEVNRAPATLPDPEDAEEKKGRHDRLVSMEHDQRGTAIDRED
jgi:hypothetical protein